MLTSRGRLLFGRDAAGPVRAWLPTRYWLAWSNLATRDIAS